MSDATIERYRDVADRWRWRLLGPDGHVLADGATVHETEHALRDWLADLRSAITGAPVVEAPIVAVEPAWTATLVDPEGEVPARSPPTTDREAAQAAAASAIARGSVPADWRRSAPGAGSRAIRAGTEPVTFDPAGAVCHRGHDGEWRWQLRYAGERVADSGEGYADADTAVEHAEAALAAVPAAEDRTWG